MDNLILEISELLRYRESVYPVRDAKFGILAGKLNEFADRLSDEAARLPPVRLSADQDRQIRGLLAKPIFLCGCMKSGTTLLAQLLDGHSQLLGIPGDAHAYRHMTRRQGVDQLSRIWTHRLINPTGLTPFWPYGKDKGFYVSFLKYLRAFLASKERNDFDCIAASLFCALGMPDGIKYWVEKTPGNASHAGHLLKRYPQAKFIHMVRHPIENTVSLKKIGQHHGWKASFAALALQVKRQIRMAGNNQIHFGPKAYKVVRFEELTTDPRRVVTEVAAFLDIPYEDILMTPTVGKQAATANSMYRDKRKTGEIVDHGKDRGYLSELSKNELRLAYDIFRPELGEWEDAGQCPRGLKADIRQFYYRHAPLSLVNALHSPAS